MDLPAHHHHGQEVFTWDQVNLALEAAEEGFFIWNIEQNTIHYTGRCLKMLGYNRDKLAPNIFTESEQIVYEEDRPFFDLEVRRYLESLNPGMPMRIEIRICNKHSNGWMWIRVNGKARYDKHRKPTELVGVFVDITRRKTSELRAQEERELFRALIDHIPNNIYVKNRDSRFIMANEATAKKLKVPTPSDVIGKTDYDFFDKAMSDISRREELEIMETGHPVTGKVHHETWQEGEDTWGMVSKFPWYGSSGQLKGLVGISSDVTKLVQAEQAIQKTAQILKERNDALEKEIDLAREIQLALLPYEIPARSYQASDILRKVSFHHIFAPSEGVAGDWFDVFPVGETGVGAIVCDVMGHGIRAALIASMLRGIIEQLIHLAIHPEQILEALNHQLFKILAHANITMFASAVYVYIDLQMKTISLASAGHPAPILMHKDGHAGKLTLPRGLALGLMDGTTYRSIELPLEPECRLLLYTDGLTEASNDKGDELGAENVISYLEKRDPQSIRDFVLSTLKCAAKFTGCSSLSDDICLLGIRYDEKADSDRDDIGLGI